MAVLLDLRAEQHPTLFPRKRNGKGVLVNTSKTEIVRGVERTIVRRPEDIDGVVIHQTACVFGASAQQVRAAGGDEALARHRRALQVCVPVVAFRDGTFVHSAELLWYLYSSNGFNARSYALECEGHFSGLLDDPTTPRREDELSIWKGAEPTPLTPTAIDCYREALRYLVNEGRKLGSPLRYLWAHRQSSGDRRSDPGEGVWKELEPFARRELHLEPQYAKTIKDGRPIPREWAAGGIGRY